MLIPLLSSPRLESRGDSIRSGRSGYGFGGSSLGRPGSGEGSQSKFGSFLVSVGMKNGGKKKMSRTSFLAEQHGIKNTTSMYFTYYIPFLAWVRQYRWSHLQGDLVAAITMCKFILPLASRVHDPNTRYNLGSSAAPRRLKRI